MYYIEYFIEEKNEVYTDVVDSEEMQYLQDEQINLIYVEKLL